VCTTIGDGSFLKPYAQEIVAAGAEDRARIIVITDHKTDHKAMSLAVMEAWNAGVNVLCPALSEQVSFMQYVDAPDMFRWNSDGRRNIGYLMSWRDGTDMMISVDDDNLPSPGWLRAHEHALTAGSMPFITCKSGFFNPCDLLQFLPGDTRVWARGFPYGMRTPATYHRELAPCDVAINAGMWTGDPDVDAITRLALHPRAFTPKTGPGPVVLGDGMWAPVNSQNTAIRRDVIPAYCYFEHTGRFADIWQGYFAQACARHLGQHVRFGTPAADCAARNDHDLLNDLALEYDGIMMLDKVLAWLTEVKLSGSTYIEVYESLRAELTEYLALDSDLANRQHALLWDAGLRMGDWLRVIGRLA
jgi:hypothetical protein